MWRVGCNTRPHDPNANAYHRPFPAARQGVGCLGFCLDFDLALDPGLGLDLGHLELLGLLDHLDQVRAGSLRDRRAIRASARALDLGLCRALRRRLLPFLPGRLLRLPRPQQLLLL